MGNACVCNVTLAEILLDYRHDHIWYENEATLHHWGSCYRKYS